MNRKLVVASVVIVILMYLYSVGSREALIEQINKLKTQMRLTTEELNLAYSMLTTDEKLKVQEFFKMNHAFFKQVHPKQND